MSNAKASKILKGMENYELGDGIRGKDGVFYAEDHNTAHFYVKTTVENYINGNEEDDLIYMSAKQVLEELSS